MMPESTRLASRELAAGRLVRPLAGAAEDVRHVGHHLSHPRAARQRRAYGCSWDGWGESSG
jgi:hypothetical protein